MPSPATLGARAARPIRISLIPLSTLVLLGAAAASCGSEPQNDELAALLHDEPVSQLSVGALSADPDGGVITGAGGNTGSDGGMVSGSGGTTGKAGSGPVGTAGSTGVGGAIGTAGTTGTAGTIGRGGVTGTAGRPGTAGTGGPIVGRLGDWSFDDCNANRTNLRDNTFMGNTAFRSVSVACAEGIGGQSVALDDKEEDIVYVPDQPNFTFSGGMTVAGWFNHASFNGVSTLFRKRDDGNNSAFALVVNKNQKYQFVVNLGGTNADIKSPGTAKLNEWTHVAASYDGFTLRLYINGILVSAKGVTGTLAPAPGPFLMGNDGSKRLHNGRIDQAMLDMRALTDAEVRGLTCLRRPMTVTATPAVSPPTPAGVPASFDIAVTNNDTATCGNSDYIFQLNSFFPNISVQPNFQFISQVSPGSTSHVTMTATASDDVDSGTFPINFVVFQQMGGPSMPFFGRVDFVVVASGCRVSTPRELMITSVGVVDDARARGDGAWSFKHLMEAMAPTPADAPDMVEQMLASFTTTQTVNSFSLAPRPGMQFIIDNWPRTPDGKLDLAQPLLQLQAIVNRFDLRNLDAHDAGEGRFVFAFLNPFYGGFPLQATLILEYKLPAANATEIQAWADRWHALGAMSPGSPEYNAALEAITERFAGRGARSSEPEFPNGSAINAVRTNEIDFGDNGIWELREFVLSPSTGLLVPATIKLTPDLSFNFTSTLASFINANEAAILAERHTVPDEFAGAPFLGGAVFNNFTTWQAPGVNNEARHKFGLNTCNGCHSTETNVTFLQISPRFPGSEAGLSGFLTGTTVFDPVTGEPRTFNDLSRRRADLRALVCPADPMTPPPGPMMGGTGTGGTGGRLTPPTSALRLGTLTKGISRTH